MFSFVRYTVDITDRAVTFQSGVGNYWSNHLGEMAVMEMPFEHEHDETKEGFFLKKRYCKFFMLHFHDF